jgi:hypothetical protein
MTNNKRPRTRLRTFLRLDDDQQWPRRRRSTARREQEPQPDIDEYTGEQLLDDWAGGWPESLRNRYADWGCSLPPLPKRRD